MNLIYSLLKVEGLTLQNEIASEYYHAVNEEFNAALAVAAIF
jgi:hypothetical protein